MMDIESRFSSTQSAPHCTAWFFTEYHMSFARSSRIQILFDPIFTLSISWVFASFFKSASVVTSCPLRSVPTSTFEAVRQLFPEAFSTPVASLVPSRDLALLSQVAPSFELLFTYSLRMGCCCCTSQSLLSVTLGAWPSNHTRSQFWEITLWMQSLGTMSWVMIANDIVCKYCNPWSCALDNFIQCTASWLCFQ